ncbi:hypothetical protein NGI46_21895 [Peribacillus butanolivorans]|nr:hypothetical protein [Peribacillus butanolivorans]
MKNGILEYQFVAEFEQEENTLNLMFKLFFEDCQLRNLCPHTLKYYREQFNAIKRPLVTMTEKDIKLLILNTVKFVIYCVLVVKYNCSIMGREGKI